MEKKYALPYAVMLFIIFYGFLGTALAAFEQKTVDEKSVQDEKSLFFEGSSTDSYTNLDLQKARYVLNEAIGTLKSPDSRNTESSTKINFSKDPKDLDILKDTVWEFTYTINSEFTDTITFGNVISTTSEDEVTLACTNQNGREGFAFFTDSPLGDKCFGISIDGNMLIEFYSFAISGTTAYGLYRHKIKSSGLYSDLYSITGIQTQGPEPECFTQADIDEAYSTGYGAGKFDGCAKLEESLNITMPCIDVSGEKIQAEFEKYNNMEDPSGYYWKLKATTESTK